MIRTWHRQIVPIALLLVGIDLWFTVGHGELGSYALLKALGGILAFSILWPLSNRIAAISLRVDSWLRRRRFAAAICVAAIVATHLFIQAHRFRAELYPKFHDESVYLIEARMLAQGRLWMPPYPPSLRDFFDSFYLISDRVYAGMYPPGTAIMLLPGIWLELGSGFMPILTAAAASALFYLVLEELFGPVRALAGVLLLVSLNLYMSMSFMALSETPLLLAQLLCFWAWMRWRKARKIAWLLPLGAAAGYGAITRPADMFCVAAAIGLAIAWELRREPAKLLKVAGAIAIAASPFLAIQLAQNIGVAGKWDETAVRYYTDANYPAPILGFRHVNAADVPHTNCLPKQVAMKQWILPAYEEHWRSNLWQIWYPDRIQEAIHQTLPHVLLVIFLPLALLSLGEIRRAAIVGAMLLFFAVYTADAVFLKHYLLAIAPAMICLVLMGWESLERPFPRARGVIFTFMLLATGAMATCALPEFNPWAAPLGTATDENRIVDRALQNLPRRPSLVMFRFDPKINSYHAEPVYNTDVAWPDDALIVRARDLGENENIRLYRYYTQRHQDRDVYLYDRAARNGRNPLTPLGTTRELSHQ
ncbi:MAG: glycosyltransferase family 39 protein [Tepidisphaeraceae bacterium]